MARAMLALVSVPMTDFGRIEATRILWVAGGDSKETCPVQLSCLPRQVRTYWSVKRISSRRCMEPSFTSMAGSVVRSSVLAPEMTSALMRRGSEKKVEWM